MERSRLLSTSTLPSRLAPRFSRKEQRLYVTSFAARMPCMRLLQSLMVCFDVDAWPDVQRVYTMTFLGRPTVVKERFKKAYRHPVLDAKLTRSRLVQVSKQDLA